MRIPALRLASLLVLAAAACAPAAPPPPVLAQAGWSWDPAVAGGHPIPVLWWDGAGPQRLPLPPGGDCAASGTVQAMAPQGAEPVLVGISVACGGTEPVMTPATWAGGEVAALPLPAGFAQGTALDVALANGHTYVGGAVGVGSPVPMVWIDGESMPLAPGALLPTGTDSGVITAIAPSENFLAAAGIVHVTGVSPPAFLGVVWVLNFGFTAGIATPLDPPSGSAPWTFGPSVAMALVGSTAWAVASIATGPGTDKPVVWVQDTTIALLGLDFTAAPYGQPTALSMVDATPYVSGFQTAPGGGRRIVPMLWAGTVGAQLSTANPSGGWGAGEGLAVLYSFAYVAGESTRPDTTNTRQVVSQPAYWANGARTDLAPLVPPGPGPTVAEPFFGWWRVPGTPISAPPDWPYPNGFAAILGSGAPVGAAGSGVARAIIAIPPG
jgi:hypothetical protein